MKKSELKNKIEGFHGELKTYRELLSISRDTMVRIVRNGLELEEMQNNLNRKYGRLSKYIKKLGNYPMRSDMGGRSYPAYETALSADILQRRGPCIDVAIQDLEYILGRLEDMSDDEFDSIFALRQLDTNSSRIIAAGDRGGDGGGVIIGIPTEHVTIQHVKNPHGQYWGMILGKVWKTIKNPVVDLTVLLVGAFLIYWLGWI